MPDYVTTPPFLSGTGEEKLQQLRNYLMLLCEEINRNLQNIGGNDLTDRERAAVQGIIRTNAGLDDVQSLRDMVVRLAEYVKQAAQTIQANTLKEEVSSGRFGRYVLAATATVPADLSGHAVTRGIGTLLYTLKYDSLEKRNWICSGVLRTGVTGMAIGQDVVTFAADGTETFHPENAVVEILDDGTVNILGAVGTKTTTQTDFNDIVIPGTYWVNVDGMSNKPSGTSGDCLLEISATTGIIRQRLETVDAVFIRRMTGTTWSSWYRFTGTAV